MQNDSVSRRIPWREQSGMLLVFAALFVTLSLFVPNFTLGGVDKSPLSKEAGPRTQSISVPVGLIGKDTAGGAYDATMVKLQVSNS